MVIKFENLPQRDLCIQNGNGMTHLRDLTNKEGLYGHGRLFAHMTVEPGNSFGYHQHLNEVEFFYILKGEGVFCDNGEEIVVRPGDLCVTGHQEHHSMENRTNEPLELLALIILE